MYLRRGAGHIGGYRKVMTVSKSEAEVTIVDCAPRDGLSAIQKIVSTPDKIRFINGLVKAGLNKIDCVAFTHPRLIPLNSDAESVMEGLEKRPDVTFVGLVPSEVACRRAVLTNIDEILTLVAASEAFNRAALGLSRRELLNKTIPAIFNTARDGGKTIRVSILTSFGCPYSGHVSPDEVLEIASRVAFMGAKEITLLDSTGMANPRQVRETIELVLGSDLDADFAVHMHDTRGTGLVNCMAAYEAGVRIFDTAIGGLSGTPFGAPELDMGFWNIPTEDLVHLFEQMGVNTGVDLGLLLERVKLAEELAGRALPGHILRAGPKSKLVRIPERLKLK